MRDYGKVFSSFWTSANIRSLSEDGRMLALYLMSCPHGTISGVFRLPDGYACEDLQWTSERVQQGFAELLANGFANRCETTKWVWIIKHFEWNQPENPNQRKSAAKVVQSIPEQCSWKPEFMRVSGEFLGLDVSHYRNHCGTVAKPLANQKQEQQQEQQQKSTSSLRSEGAESAGEKSGLPAANESDDSLLSAIFEVGLPAMLAGGCSEKSARSLLGRLRKELGDLEALVAVEAMRREQPLDAAAWASAAIKARKSTAVSLDAFMAGCRERGESVVSGYTPIFDYAEQAGIPDEFIRLAWDEFKRRHMPGGIWASTKREDWRLSFLAALQTNAMRLWYADSKGALLLTAAGLQADAAGRAAA